MRSFVHVTWVHEFKSRWLLRRTTHLFWSTSWLLHTFHRCCRFCHPVAAGYLAGTVRLQISLKVLSEILIVFGTAVLWNRWNVNWITNDIEDGFICSKNTGNKMTVGIDTDADAYFEVCIWHCINFTENLERVECEIDCLRSMTMRRFFWIEETSCYQVDVTDKFDLGDERILRTHWKMFHDLAWWIKLLHTH